MNNYLLVCDQYIEKIENQYVCPIWSAKTDCVDTSSFPLYNLRGNVSEISAHEGISFGGGWKDDSTAMLNNEYFQYAKPNAWTGFRNVCEWKKVENLGG